MTALYPGVLIATFRCAAPACCGAFADERRVVAGDAGGRVYRFACATLVASFATDVPAWDIASCGRAR